MATEELRTTEAVIRALGGVREVATLTGRTYPAAFNWKAFETFPSNTFLVMTKALAERGLSAPASLWGMVEGAEPADGKAVA